MKKNTPIFVKDIDDVDVAVNDINNKIETNNKLNLKITDYQLLDNYDNKYVVCKDIETCTAYSSIIRAKGGVSSTMLVLDFDLTVDDNAMILKTFNTSNKIFTNYATVEFSTFNKDYSIDARVVVNSDVRGKVFLEVPRNIINASKIKVRFNFRDDKFNVILKEHTNKEDFLKWQSRNLLRTSPM